MIDPSVFSIHPRQHSINQYIAVFLALYLVVVFVIRTLSVGEPYPLYDLPWGCNVTLAMAAYGAFTGQSLFIGEFVAYPHFLYALF